MAVDALPAAHVGLPAARLLQPGVQLKLRALFSRAAHAATPGGELLVITDDDRAAPWALGVPGLPWSRLGGKTRVGLTVSADSPAYLSLEDLTINLAPARVWPSPSPCPVAPVEAVRAALRRTALPHTAPGLADHDAGPLVAHLSTALSEGTPAAIAAACAPLVGLGRGLTPAGDDLVAGVLGALALTGLPCCVPPLAGRTTLLGATQVAHSAAGALIEPLHRVISALLAGTPAPPEAVRRTLALGQSSGADMLAGAHLALDAISGRRPGH